MIFNTYDELLTYLKDKNLPDLEFNISVVSNVNNFDNETSSTLDSEPCNDIVTPDSTGNIVAIRFESFSDKPTIEFVKGDKNLLVIEDYEHVPNSCSTSSISIGGRELLTRICENNDGLPVSNFDVIINGVFYPQQQFILTTDKTQENTINL